ncbi:MAG: NAD(P)H-binding protein [Flammeovirgaceae bacterium]|nr:MAG: NAD(P)H-binding protein [Flammeovirgaceae bacterium]
MTSDKQILVTGGTGKLGTVLVAQLLKNNFRFEVLTSKKTESAPPSFSLVYGNLVNGEGLENALRGVELIIHCASNFFDHESIDVAGTQKLIDNLDRASVNLLIYVSIVGVNKIPLPYYKSKRKAELIIQQSGFPYLILRFTQFHDFVLHLLDGFEQQSTALPYFEIPDKLQFQSISMDDATATILSTIKSTHKGIIETGGPEILPLNKMAETYLLFKRNHKKLKTFEATDELHKAFTGGKNLTANKLTGGITWEMFLEQNPALVF